MSSSSPRIPSPFLSLAPEIRLIIYDELFRSTRLRWGTRLHQHNVGQSIVTNAGEIQAGSFNTNQLNPIEPNWTDFRSYRWKPAPNALALLRTCSLIHREASHLWLSRVVFFFDDGDAMRRKLNNQPLHRVKQIRTLVLVASAPRTNELYEAGEELSDIEGLQLETLIVLGAHSKRIRPDPALTFSYEWDFNRYVLGGMLAYSPSWNNFYFVAPNNNIMVDNSWTDDATLGRNFTHYHHGRRCQSTVIAKDESQESTGDDVLRWSRDQPQGSCNDCILRATVCQGDGQMAQATFFLNLHQRLLADLDDGRPVRHSSTKCRRTLIIVSGHRTIDDAAAEKEEQIDPGQSPCALPTINLPLKPTFAELQRPLMRDRYQGVLDYDWNAEWGNAAANA